MNSLGFVEVSGVVAAVDALDIMCKSADVSLVSWERKLGGRLVTLIVTGSVSAVNAAVENACARCIKKPVAHAVIANPHPETYRLAMLSFPADKRYVGTLAHNVKCVNRRYDSAYLNKSK